MDHEAVVLRALAMCFHPQPPVVREACQRFARVALALRSATSLHSSVVDWVLHALAAKQQSSNSATLQHQADVMELLPAVVPTLSVNAALRLFERLLSLFTVGRLAPVILATLWSFFDATEMDVPVRLSVAVQSLLSRMQPSTLALQLHGALLKHLPDAGKRDSLLAMLHVASTATVPVLVSASFEQLTRYMQHAPPAPLYDASLALCAAPFGPIHGRLLDLLALSLQTHHSLPLPPALLQAVLSLPAETSEQQSKVAAVLGSSLRISGPDAFIACLQPSPVTWPLVLRALCSHGQNSSLGFFFRLLQSAPPDATPPAVCAAPTFAVQPLDLEQSLDTFLKWVLHSLSSERPLYCCKPTCFCGAEWGVVPLWRR